MIVAAPTSVVLDALPGADRLLTATEHGRMARLRSPGDRRDFLAAHALARVGAGLAAGAAADGLTLLQRCPRCGGVDHGRPSVRELPELHVSLSHTSGYVAAIAGRGPVGVDVERANRRPLQEDVAALALAPGERVKVAGANDPGRAFLRVWVRKEALVKAGELSLDGLGSADLSALEPGRRWRGLCLRDWS